MHKKLQKRRPDDLTVIVATSFFALVTLGGLAPPFIHPFYAKATFAPLFNAAASVGTGGLVSLILYWSLTRRLERHTKNIVKAAALESYANAKHEIAWSVVHASMKGGRSDLAGTSETIDLMMKPAGFRSLFEGGRESHEGFYAFQNEMSDATPEYVEIVFNLKRIARSPERLLDSGAVHDPKLYSMLIRLDALVQRIEKNGAGYDQSKLLCSFIWEIFTGWNVGEGDTGGDPILRALEQV
ncbi:MAG: hypothetical protein LKF80_04855 [Brevundimonas sp.]|jgi:hypothetical protein|uniref:hypothetical protein n=1 Tax=Brevundimonas sp. TaxID=1871086 RepID=UPI0025C01946|nr:hypothetical protein [Brevundimonas sp.]MCH4267713.1 hypothetical protein [Brevundimonas sp.]